MVKKYGMVPTRKMKPIVKYGKNNKGGSNYTIKKGSKVAKGTNSYTAKGGRIYAALRALW